LGISMVVQHKQVCNVKTVAVMMILNQQVNVFSALILVTSDTVHTLYNLEPLRLLNYLISL